MYSVLTSMHVKNIEYFIFYHIIESTVQPRNFARALFEPYENRKSYAEIYEVYKNSRLTLRYFATYKHRYFH